MRIELRNDGGVNIRGYVNAVERDSRVLPKTMSPQAKGDFVERVRAGTFARAIARGNPIELRFNHRRGIGGTEEGTLRLREDNIGLYADATVYDDEVREAARDGRLRGWSFAFRPEPGGDEWEDAGDGMQRRTLTDIDLSEVSILTDTPAYIGTSIEMRGEDLTVRESRGSEDIITETVRVPDYTALRAEIEILRRAKKERPR